MTTNEEWIRSLPTEGLARVLKCGLCTKEYEEQNNCFAPDCLECKIEWLKAVHNENN